LGLKGQVNNSSVSGQMIMTNTPVKSTESNSGVGNSKKETSEQLTLMKYPTTTSSVRDFLARVSLSLEIGGDTRIQGEHSFLKYAEAYKLKNPRMFSLRMSRDYYPTIKELQCLLSSNPLMNWGMTVNGKCLTAMTLVRAKDHASLSLRYFGTTKIMAGKGISKPFRYLLAAERGLDMRTLTNRKICETPSELYEHMQGFPLGWTLGIPSTYRKKCLGNAVSVPVPKAIGRQLLNEI